MNISHGLVARTSARAFRSRASAAPAGHRRRDLAARIVKVLAIFVAVMQGANGEICRAQVFQQAVLDTGGHNGFVRHIACLPDGKHFVTLGTDRKLCLWNSQSRAIVGTIHLPPSIGNVFPDLVVSDSGDFAAFSYANSSIASAVRSAGVLVVGLRDGSLLATQRSDFATQSLAFVERETTLLVGHRGGVESWNWQRSEEARSVAERVGDSAQQVCRLSRNGEYFVTYGAKTETTLTRLRAGPIKSHPINGAKAERVAFSPNSELVAALAPDGLQVWGVAKDFRSTYTLPVAKSARSIDFLSDKLIVCRSATDFHLIDLGRDKIGKIDAPAPTAMASFAPYEDAVVSALTSGSLQYWTYNGEQLKQLREPFGLVAPLPRSIKWADGGRPSWETDGRRHSLDLKQLRMETKAVAREAEEPGAREAQGPLQVKLPIVAGVSMTCSAEVLNEYVVSGSADGKLHVWRSQAKEPLGFIQAHAQRMRHIAVSPENGLILTSSDDRLLKIWRLTGESHLPELVLSTFAIGSDWIAWTAEGFYASTPPAERWVGLLPKVPPRDDEREALRAAATRPIHLDQYASLLFRPEQVADRFQLAAERKDFKLVEMSGQLAVPELKWVDPVLKPNAETGKLGLRLRVVSPSKEPIEQIVFTVNGVKSTALKGAQLEGEVEVELSLEPGDNRIVAYAYDRKGMRSDSPELTVSAAADSGTDRASTTTKGVGPFTPLPSRKFGNLCVVGIGVSNYPHYKPLKFAHLDAKEIVEFLQKQDSGAPYGQVKSHLVVEPPGGGMNGSAKRDDIQKALYWPIKNSAPGDTVVFIISAHGVRDAVGTYHIAGSDFDPSDVNNTGVHWAQFVTAIDNLVGRRVVAMIDTCNAEGITGDSKAPIPWRGLSDARCGAVVFASSVDGSPSYELDEVGKHGAFSKGALEVFVDKTRDLEPNRYLSTNELNTGLFIAVQRLTGDKQCVTLCPPPGYISFDLLRLP